MIFFQRKIKPPKHFIHLVMFLELLLKAVSKIYNLWQKI